MGFVTVVNKASTKGNSLRTTIPSSIVKLFNIKEKDRLLWDVKAINGEMIIIVKPMRCGYDRNE
jgi:bifunctional DNA-binding transcriptional regulator/antitoxin component of YhaV-PrlF toxin-antitoxin module